jgi:chemotaxis protein MotB
MSKKPLPTSEGGAPEWMVSYADMITIVLAFFVVLYSTTSGSGTQDRGHNASSTGHQRGTNTGDEDSEDKNGATDMRKVMTSLNNRFGPSWTLSNCWAGGPIASRSRSEKDDDQYIRGFRGGQTGGNSSVTLPLARTSEYTVPGGRIFFEEFSATLDPSQQKELNLVSEDMAGKLQKIELRGHASHRPLPKGSPWKNAWELAFARCQAVAYYLQAHGVDPRRMRIAVAADNEPFDAVSDPPYGERNSRVEIRLLNEWLNEGNNLQGRPAPKLTELKMPENLPAKKNAKNTPLAMPEKKPDQ